MKVEFTPDPPPRNTKFHKSIVNMKRGNMNNSRRALITLECGHQAYVFGNTDLLNGIAFCRECYDDYRKAQSGAG